MGTNLNQVFVSNYDGATVASTALAFNAVQKARVGVWDVIGGAYLESALYNTSIDLTAETAGDDDALTAIANPVWRYNQLQFVQGTAGNPIATPMINTRNIRRIKHDPYEATAGHKTVLTPNGTTFTGATTGDVTIRIIARSVPSDYLSYYDGDGTDYTILSGSDQFPLGAYNTTNHKAISVEVRGADFTSAATFIDKAKEAIEANGVLDKLVAVTDGNTTMTIQSKHVGFIFDVVITETADNTDLIVGTAAANKITETVTGQVLGVGNPWQVLGEELRCRYRQGNFNRMYLPQNPETYTQADGKYNKIVIEYEHNWPNSTGIAPAGALNQAVIYFDSDGAAVTTSEGDFDTLFAISDLTASAEFIF